MSTLAEEVARLTKENAELRAEKDQLAAELAMVEGELEGCYQMAGLDDERMAAEVRTLRSFVDDMRLGIRELSEYHDVCGPVYL